MQRDNELIMSDGQDFSAQGVGSVVSTNIIDRGAKGELDEDLWLVLRSGTAFTSAGAATIQADLETADDAAFSTNKKTIFSTGALGKAVLAANTEFAKTRVPIGRGRYLRINYTIAVAALTAGTIDAFLALNARVGSY